MTEFDRLKIGVNEVLSFRESRLVECHDIVVVPGLWESPLHAYFSPFSLFLPVQRISEVKGACRPGQVATFVGVLVA